MKKNSYFMGWASFKHLHHMPKTFVTYHGLHKRKADIHPADWIMDSGGFSWMKKGEQYPDTPEQYADKLKRWSTCGNLIGAVSQDIMPICGEPLDVCQKQTIENYVRLRKAAAVTVPDTHILPVILGDWPHEYGRHVEQYGEVLPHGCYVCVGSIVPHSSNFNRLVSTFRAIKAVRPDLRLHGLGLKLAAIKQQRVRDFLYSADSSAWTMSFMAELQVTLAEYRAGQRPRKNTTAGQIDFMNRYRAKIDACCDPVVEPIDDPSNFVSEWSKKQSGYGRAF